MANQPDDEIMNVVRHEGKRNVPHELEPKYFVLNKFQQIIRYAFKFLFSIFASSEGKVI